MIIQVLWIIIAYLLGSLSSAIIVCRLFGFGDPREVGSGNPGATNVLRYFGKQAAAITLTGDFLKGLVPVLIAQGFDFHVISLSLVALAAFAGHLYPVYFDFRGGKGVATYFGVVTGLALPLGMVFGVCWLATAAVFRYSSLAAITAALASLAVAVIFGFRIQFVISLLIMIALLVWRHRGNLRNLVGGTENKIEI